jgi:hypothetical protein
MRMLQCVIAVRRAVDCWARILCSSSFEETLASIRKIFWVSSSSSSSSSDAKSVSSQHVAAVPFGFSSKYALTVTPTKIIALNVASKLAVAWTKLLPAKGQRSATKVRSTTELLVVDV